MAIQSGARTRRWEDLAAAKANGRGRSCSAVYRGKFKPDRLNVPTDLAHTSDTLVRFIRKVIAQILFPGTNSQGIALSGRTKPAPLNFTPSTVLTSIGRTVGRSAPRRGQSDTNGHRFACPYNVAAASRSADSVSAAPRESPWPRRVMMPNESMRTPRSIGRTQSMPASQ